MMTRPQVKSFFHEGSNTFSHVVWDASTMQAAVFDTVLDYDAASGHTAHESADAVSPSCRPAGLPSNG